MIAAHSDQALAMLSDADERERPFSARSAIAQRGLSASRHALMPKRRRAWAAWNFLRWPREGGVR